MPRFLPWSRLLLGAAALALSAASPCLAASGSSADAAPPATDAHAAQPAQAGAEPVVATPSYRMKSGRMQCGSRQVISVHPEDEHDNTIRLTWKGRHYVLVRQPTTTGAYHFDDRKAGLVMIQIPAKSMLFDDKHMVRLADDCNPVVASQ